MADKHEPIIIIKKKVAGHAGHHGGAWKVAYADFVTAMMSLFIVLWLTSSNTTSRSQSPLTFKIQGGHRSSKAAIIRVQATPCR